MGSKQILFLKIKDRSDMKRALKNSESLLKHLQTYSINAKEKTTGNTLLHYIIDNFPKESPSLSLENLVRKIMMQGANPYIKKQEWPKSH